MDRPIALMQLNETVVMTWSKENNIQGDINAVKDSKEFYDVVMKEIVCEDVDGSGGEVDVGPDHDAEHGEAGVVVQPVEAVLSLHEVTEAADQLVVQIEVVSIQFVNSDIVLLYLSLSWRLWTKFRGY